MMGIPDTHVKTNVQELMTSNLTLGAAEGWVLVVITVILL